MRRQVNGQRLCHQLGNAVHQTDRAEPRQCGDLAEQHHVRRVQQMETPSVERPEGVEDRDNVRLDCGPSSFIEPPRKAIRPRGLVVWDFPDDGPNFLLRELVSQVTEINLRRADCSKLMFLEREK